VRGRALCLAALVAGAAVVRPAAAASPTNEDCLACHEDTSQKRADGRPLGADLGRFAASVHGQAGLSCVDCHADLAAATEFPHAERLAPAQCASCHADASAQYAASIHARARAGGGGGGAATCRDCHGAHDILPAADAASRTNHFNVAATCGSCHGDPARIGSGAVPGGQIVSRYQDSIHGQAVSQSGLKVAPHCGTCHGSHDVRANQDAQSRVFRANVAGTCGSCHEGIRARYEDSVHGTQVQAGNLKAAVCSDCHTAHAIQVNAPEWKLAVIRECGTCHEESLRTYRDGFHGQATALGFTRVAACSDCHTSHEILPRDDPRSSVAEGRLVHTCGRCHVGATTSFVKFDPHADAHDRERSRPVYYTAMFMKVLLAGVFAFFGIHTALWFPRELRERRRRRREGGHGA
jgi:hypothetical protein